MTQFQQEAANLTDKNSDMLQGFAFLLSVYGLALAQFERDHDHDQAKQNNAPETQTITETDMILNETIHILFVIRGHTVNPNDLDLLNAVKNLQYWIDSSTDAASTKDTNTRTLAIFTEALAFKLKRNLRPLVWPNVIDNAYLELLRARNPIALVILAHYAIVLGHCKA
ncbi:hypothetical protein BDW74DRAFT_180472 [Aspergillus multicolor]|uniref:uncharacterized protein n=1 Tax=Aspergillus multicolor TaxID=41759 RepID=UPI003CCD67EE